MQAEYLQATEQQYRTTVLFLRYFGQIKNQQRINDLQGDDKKAYPRHFTSEMRTHCAEHRKIEGIKLLLKLFTRFSGQKWAEHFAEILLPST